MFAYGNFSDVLLTAANELNCVDDHNKPVDEYDWRLPATKVMKLETNDATIFMEIYINTNGQLNIIFLLDTLNHITQTTNVTCVKV